MKLTLEQKVFIPKIKKSGIVKAINVPDKLVRVTYFGVDKNRHTDWFGFNDVVKYVNKPVIKFAKVKPNAIIPSKKEENAGMDIYACFEEDYKIIKSHETVMIPTGIASSCSDDYYFQLFERGSTGTKGIGQRCGVIDSSFRGEWFIPITNHNNHYIVIKKAIVTIEEIWGDLAPNDAIYYPYEKALCQAVILPVPKVTIKEISYEELKNIPSERGTGQLGSSNK